MTSFKSLTINMNGKGGQNEKDEAEDLYEENNIVRSTVAASRRYRITEIIEDQTPTVVFAQEITTKKAWSECLPNGFQKTISGSEAGVAWKKNSFKLIREIDAGQKLTALQKIRGRSTREFELGRCCIVVLRHKSNKAKILMASWHGKHKATNDRKSDDFRILQHLICNLQAVHECHAAIIGGDFNYARADARESLFRNHFFMLEGQMIADQRNKDDFFLWKGPQFVSTNPTANTVQGASSTNVLDHFPVTSTFRFQDPTGAAAGGPIGTRRVEQGPIHLLHAGGNYVVSAATKRPQGRHIVTFTCPDKLKGREKVVEALNEKKKKTPQRPPEENSWTKFRLDLPEQEIIIIVQEAVNEIRYKIDA